MLRFSDRNSAERALSCGALVEGRRPADVVAHARVLDLQHLGAEVGQQQRAEAARQQAREVEHADALRAAGSRASPRARASPSIARASATVAGRRPTSSVICLRLRDQLAVGARHLAVRQVQVVLQAHADRAAERERRADEHPLLARDADHAPVRALRDVRRPSPPGCARSAGSRRRRPSRSRRAAASFSTPMSISGARLPTWPTSKHSCSGLMRELVHRLEQLDDLLEGVLEDHVEDELLARARVLRVVHRAHVQRRHLRAAGAQVFDALGDRHADRAGREVDDRRVAHLGADRVGDRLRSPRSRSSACRPVCARGCGSCTPPSSTIRRASAAYSAGV